MRLNPFIGKRLRKSKRKLRFGTTYANYSGRVTGSAGRSVPRYRSTLQKSFHLFLWRRANQGRPGEAVRSLGERHYSRRTRTIRRPGTRPKRTQRGPLISSYWLLWGLGAAATPNPCAPKSKTNPGPEKLRADTCGIRPDLSDSSKGRLYIPWRPVFIPSSQGRRGHPPVLSEVIRPSNACFSCSSGMMMVGLTRMSSTLSPLILDRLV